MKKQKTDWFLVMLGVGFLALSFWFFVKGSMIFALIELFLGISMIIKQLYKSGREN